MTSLAHANHLTLTEAKSSIASAWPCLPRYALCRPRRLPSGKPIVGAGAAIPVKGQIPPSSRSTSAVMLKHKAAPMASSPEIRNWPIRPLRNSVAVPVDLTTPMPNNCPRDPQEIEIIDAEPVG